jgi:hypothetical protein
VATIASPAQAGIWQLNDGFENNPLGRWSFSGAGNHFGNFDGTNGVPRSGLEYADLTQWDVGWSAVGRNVHLHSAPATCGASVWILTSSVSSNVNLEIIDPATWTYISVKQVTVPRNNFAWQNFTFNTWTVGKQDVVLRIALLGPGSVRVIKVDDLVVQCIF